LVVASRGLGNKPVPNPLSVDEPRGVGKLEKSRRDLPYTLQAQWTTIHITYVSDQYISGRSSFYSKCTYR